MTLMCCGAPSAVFSKDELSRANIDRSHKKLVMFSKADKIPSNIAIEQFNIEITSSISSFQLPTLASELAYVGNFTKHWQVCT